MPKVVVEGHDNLAIVRLTSGVTNAISPALVEDLSTAVKRVEGRFRGVVLAGGAKFLSIGFDLPTLLKLNRAEMTKFFVNSIKQHLHFLPCPFRLPAP